jgi:hypothetical protein
LEVFWMRALFFCLLGLGALGTVWAQVSSRVEDAVVDALTRADVYVAPGMEEVVDAAQLQRVSNDLKPFTVKFVVVPLSDRQSRDRWATALRRYLNIREGAVIVMVPKMANTRGGVSASSGVIPPKQVEAILQQHLAAFSTQGYTQGLEQLARGLRDHYVAERRSSLLGTTALVGIPTVLVIGGVAWVIRRRAREVARLKAQLQNQRAQVLEGIEYVDGYLDVLPAGEDATRVREHRQRAAELQTQAVQLMENAKRPQDLWRAEHLLDKAQISVEKAKKYILRAGGDTSIQVEEEPEESVAPESYISIRPNDRTYACFFCSKPPTLSELQPVEVTVGEQTRKVWACEDCAAQLQRGETPAMRVFRDGDRMRPWYENPDYDPYRDYGRPYPGMDWVSLLLLGSILSHPAPVIIHEHEPANVGGDNVGADAGGGDFFDGTSGWSETTGNDAGGGDFFDSLFGGFDAGDVDAGGGDFADFDVGGDFGGDVGGGDF